MPQGKDPRQTAARVPSPERGLHALGIGVAVRDIVVQLDEFPTPDEKFRATGLFEVGGGPVPTALVTMARLGRKTAFCGVLGEDSTGKLIVDGLTQEGVATSGVVLRKDFASPTSVILVEGGRRTILECGQTALPLSIDELEPERVDFRNCHYLMVDARLPDVQIAAAHRVRRTGGRVVLDCGRPRAGVEEILNLTDVAILSHTYPKTLYGEDYDLGGFLTELWARLPPDGLRVAGLTLGAEGSAIVSAQSSLIRIPGHEVEAVDSTGAGDVFHGAFVHALISGDSPETAARFANAAAALKCRGMTGRFPLPPEEEIRRLAEGYST